MPSEKFNSSMNIINEILQFDNGFDVNLINGTTSHPTIITPELKRQKEIAANPNISLDDRIKTYEDIFNPMSTFSH